MAYHDYRQHIRTLRGGLLGLCSVEDEDSDLDSAHRYEDQNVRFCTLCSVRSVLHSQIIWTFILFNKKERSTPLPTRRRFDIGICIAVRYTAAMYFSDEHQHVDSVFVSRTNLLCWQHRWAPSITQHHAHCPVRYVCGVASILKRNVVLTRASNHKVNRCPKSFLLNLIQWRWNSESELAWNRYAAMWWRVKGRKWRTWVWCRVLTKNELEWFGRGATARLRKLYRVLKNSTKHIFATRLHTYSQFKFSAKALSFHVLFLIRKFCLKVESTGKGKHCAGYAVLTTEFQRSLTSKTDAWITRAVRLVPGSNQKMSLSVIPPFTSASFRLVY